MTKRPNLPARGGTVRARRAYFDCRFGQLHVRTALSTSGGFDEGVTLVCLHPSEGTSRVFDRFLLEIAADRSVYAPDLPGFGESDPAHRVSVAAAAEAVADLAADLRLRQIDLLGLRFGASVALELASGRPDLVRRLVLFGVPPIERWPVVVVAQESLILRIQRGGNGGGGGAAAGADSEAGAILGLLPNATFMDLEGYGADLFEAHAETLATRIAAFLDAD